MHYLLIYKLVDDYIEMRANYRAEHLAIANEFVASGKLILGGALANPPDQAVLIFDVASKDTIEDFVQRDPYVRHGLVREWAIREWTTVVGPLAKSPVK